MPVYSAARSYGVHEPDFKTVGVSFDLAAKQISAALFEDRCGLFVPLHFRFVYKPSMRFAPIHEIAGDRSVRVKDFSNYRAASCRARRSDTVELRHVRCQTNRIPETFNNAALREVLDDIAHCTGRLLEIVDLSAEESTKVLNYLKLEKIDIAKLCCLVERFNVDRVKVTLGEIVDSCFTRAKNQQKAGGYIKLERGFITIPPTGIGAPFHSRYLVLWKWDQENWGSAEQHQKLAYVILVELLAQFAASVRWIESQDIPSTHYGFERFSEIGPSPTLTGMASRTLNAKTPRRSTTSFEVEPEADSAEPAEAETAASTPVAAVPVAAAAAPCTSPAASIEDVPLKAVNILAISAAQKLKKQLNEIPLFKSVKDLVGGKPEILGDLQLEFSAAPEKGEEVALEKLSFAFSVSFSGTLGNCTSGLVSGLIGGKMPGDFNLLAMKSYLSKAWGLDSSRADGVLLLADARACEIKHNTEKTNVAALQVKLDAVSKEHGDTSIHGIQPVFYVLKACHPGSS
ncbi:hypothetical protein CERSUDRAFT_78517 [Gelatoporia subvermispora B]|uniref:Uncharacterized protein n=1 Tax=Ceriporiopsis subvermispora (strain B) TaxID=914234 RepID=M2QYF2_CERS8|nr:hypothetical protein CERSUDRAFT_78517 [Gelatoporia subvermispora B]